METGNENSTFKTITNYINIVAPVVNVLFMVLAYTYTGDMKKTNAAFEKFGAEVAELKELVLKQGRDMDFVMRRLNSDEDAHKEFSATDRELIERLHELEKEQIRQAK